MCRRPMEARRSTRTFCSDACRVRAYRRRKAGLPEAFLAAGASSLGSLSLSEFRGRIRHVLELVEMGADLKHDQVTLLLRR